MLRLKLSQLAQRCFWSSCLKVKRLNGVGKDSWNFYKIVPPRRDWAITVPGGWGSPGPGAMVPESVVTNKQRGRQKAQLPCGAGFKSQIISMNSCLCIYYITYFFNRWNNYGKLKSQRVTLMFLHQFPCTFLHVGKLMFISISMKVEADSWIYVHTCDSTQTYIF